MLFCDLINECVEQLNIKWPFEIKIKHSDNKHMCAKYVLWKYKSGRRRHVITVYLEAVNQNQRKLETLIAHEFVHAWQAENGYEDEIHGKSFKTMSRSLETVLKLKGFKVKNLYIKKVDL